MVKLVKLVKFPNIGMSPFRWSQNHFVLHTSVRITNLRQCRLPVETETNEGILLNTIQLGFLYC